MKRGRPNIRNKIKPLIIEILNNNRVPISVNKIKKEIDKVLMRDVSWNTIKKYLDELVRLGSVQPITLSHSKLEKKEGLTVYTIKR